MTDSAVQVIATPTAMVSATAPATTVTISSGSMAKSISSTWVTNPHAPTLPRIDGKDRGQRAKHAVLDEEGADHVAAGGAEHLHHHGVGFALGTAGGHGAGEDEEPADHGDAADDRHRVAQRREDRGQHLDGVADGDEVELGEVLDQHGLERALAALGGLQHADVVDRELLDDAGREDHRKVDAARPVDPAEALDGRGDHLAVEADLDGVADLEAHLVAEFGRERHQCGAVVAGRPPLALVEVGRAHGVGIDPGDRRLALEEEADVLGVGLVLGDRLVRELDDRGAHHRGRVEALDPLVGLGQLREGFGFVGEEVGEDEGRRVGLHLRFDLGAEVVLDQRDQQQQREAEAERQDHRGGRRTGPVDRREGVAEVGVGQRRDPPQDPLEAGGGEPQDKERNDRAHGVPEDELRPSRGQQRKADEPRGRDEQRQPDTRIERIAPAPSRRDPAAGRAEEQRRLERFRPRERKEGEGKAHEEPKARRGEQRRRMDRGIELDREQVADDRQRDQREDRAKREADQDAEQRQQHDLEQEVREDARAGGAEAAERRDRALPLGDVGAHRVRHADAADEQRGEADDHEEAGEDGEEARERLGRVGRRADVPRRLGEGAADLVARRGKGHAGIEEDLVAVAREGTGMDQAGGHQPFDRGQRRNADLEALRRLVGQAVEDATHLELRIADLELRRRRRSPCGR